MTDHALLGKPRCANCNAGMKLAQGEQRRIACRAHPPTAQAFMTGLSGDGKPNIHQTMMLPVCDENDWCREHQFESTIVKA